MYSLSCNRFIQYKASLASFNAMDILLTKSARLCANLASQTSAPIAVPLLMFCAHYILLSLGRHTAKLFGAAESAGLVTSALLVALGIYRLIG